MCLILFLENFSVLYEAKVKSSQPSLHETEEKRPLERRHTMSTIKLSWVQPMAPWASVAAYGPSEKSLA